jgi:hypothetical protein
MGDLLDGRALGYALQLTNQAFSPLTLNSSGNPVPTLMLFEGDAYTTLKSVYLSSAERPSREDQYKRFTPWFVIWE